MGTINVKFLNVTSPFLKIISMTIGWYLRYSWFILVMTLLLNFGEGSVSNLNSRNSLATHALPDVNDAREDGQTWAILIAGSNESLPLAYAEEANVCHAYQVLHNRGIPDENIIVFMYDDVANNKKNPHQGKIFNKPGGKDVYHGVPKDYTGKNETLDNLYAVLAGNATVGGSGKTLKSGPKDNIFIFYSDHGWPGGSTMPDQQIKATKLNEALHDMHDKKMFDKMLIYWESCFSGSMFDNGLLSPDKNILSVTAANPFETAKATYCNESAWVECLGGEFSVAWLEDSDERGNLSGVTVFDQVKVMDQRTTHSHIQIYGDASILDMPLSKFLGYKSTIPQERTGYDGLTVAQPDVPIFKLREQIRALLTGRKAIEDTVMSILEPVLGNDKMKTSPTYNLEKLTPEDMDKCYYPLVDAFSNKCFDMGCNSYTHQEVGHFVKACTGLQKTYGNYPAMERVLQSMEDTCDFGVRNSVCGVE